MIKFHVGNIEKTIEESIREQISFMCSYNNINKTKQSYYFLTSKSVLLKQNNDIFYTSGSKKYLSFYGRCYIDMQNHVTEKVKDSGIDFIDLMSNQIIIISGGSHSSTVVEYDTPCIEFYVAPGHLLTGSNKDSWVKL